MYKYFFRIDIEKMFYSMFSQTLYIILQPCDLILIWAQTEKNLNLSHFRNILFLVCYWWSLRVRFCSESLKMFKLICDIVYFIKGRRDFNLPCLAHMWVRSCCKKCPHSSCNKHAKYSKGSLTFMINIRTTYTTTYLKYKQSGLTYRSAWLS